MLRTEPTQKKSWIKAPAGWPVRHRGGITRLFDSLKFLLKQLTVTRLAFVVFVLPALFYLYDEATHSVLIIDPINLPDGFSKNGFTSAVMANRIGDALRRMEESAQTQMKKDKLRSLQEEALTPDIEVPGVKVGVQEVVDITRGIFNIYPKHITGDLVTLPAPPAYLANVDTTICDDVSPKAGHPAAIVAVYATVKRSRSAAVRVALPADDLDALVQCTAEIVLKQVNPYVLAVYKMQQGKDDLSLQIIEGILQDPSQDRSARIAAYIFKGNVLSHQKRYDEAEASFTQAIEIDRKRQHWYNHPKFAPSFLALPPPHTADVYNSWGNMFDDKGEYGNAIEQYRKAIQFDPKSAMAYNNWGFVIDEQNDDGNGQNSKRYDDAIEKYKEATDVDPNFADAYINWGFVIDERNVTGDPTQFQAAIEKYKTAIQCDPKVPQAYNNWGEVLARWKKFPDAAAKYRKATELDPKYAEAYLNWGNALFDQQKYADAIEKYQQAIKLNPKYAEAYMNWGKVLYKQKKYPEAMEKRQQAITLDPKSAEAQ